MKEIWDLVDINGKDSGVKYDREKGGPIPEGLCFKVVEVWVKVGDKILITCRHPEKWEGNKWEVPGGGVLSGESERDAAIRELGEEVGVIITDGMMKELGVTLSPPAIIYSYAVTLDREPTITLQASEVVDYRLVRENETAEFYDKFTSGTRERYKKYQREIFK